MASQSAADLIQHFSGLTDPRIERTKEHKLNDIVVIAICAIIAGADGWVAVETFGRAKEKWLRTFLALPNGIPSHDTFWRVFGLPDPTEFVQAFFEWVQAISQTLKGQISPWSVVQIHSSPQALVTQGLFCYDWLRFQREQKSV